MPEIDKEKGKTYTYLDEITGEYTYVDIFYQVIDGRKALVQKSYNDAEVLDSTIEVDGRLIETYSSLISNINQAKAKILKNSIIGNG